jgi:hypothetical protein
VHQLVHVAQCERSGGLESFVAEYLADRRNSRNFSLGSLEEEARSFAHELCARPVVATAENGAAALSASAPPRR